MTVIELIEELKKMPQNANVSHLWDGASRTNIQFVWLSKGGKVITSDFNMVAYEDKDRPLDAPTQKENKHWSSPKHKEWCIGGEKGPCNCGGVERE